jgi:hypothetical protein
MLPHATLATMAPSHPYVLIIHISHEIELFWETARARINAKGTPILCSFHLTPEGGHKLPALGSCVAQSLVA